MCNLVTTTLIWSHPNLLTATPYPGTGECKERRSGLQCCQVISSQQMGTDPLRQTLKVRLSLQEISLRYFLFYFFKRMEHKGPKAHFPLLRDYFLKPHAR